MRGQLRGGRSRSREDSVLLIATDNPEERDCLCAWGASVGLCARVLPAQDLGRTTDTERGVVMRVGLYRPDAHGGLCPWPHRRATILICEEPWDRICQMLRPQADVDCICRPYARSELLWRAERALSRVRESGRERRGLRLGPLRYDPTLCEVRVGGKPIDLRRAEREILVYLLGHPNRYISTMELQDAVLRSHGDGGAVRTQIYEIRRKLALVGLGDRILCEPRKGYRLLAVLERRTRI